MKDHRGAGFMLMSLVGALVFLALAPVGAAPSELPAVSAKLAPAIRLVEVEKTREGMSKGTAFIVCPERMLVTAAHLVNGAGSIVVKRSKEDVGVAARVLVENKGWDIAILEMGGSSQGEGICLSLSSSPVQPAGIDVAYSGFAFGTDQGYMSVYSTYRGIISSVLAQENEGVPGHIYNLGSLVITGLSGSPLYLPESGMVVGIVVSHYGPKGMGVGFGGAVAADALCALMECARGAKAGMELPAQH